MNTEPTPASSAEAEVTDDELDNASGGYTAWNGHFQEGPPGVGC